MSTRAVLPGTLFLSFAFILSLLVAISLPALPTLDIARCHFTGGTAPHVSTNTESINQIRFGVWAYCIYDAQTSHRTCIDQGHGYSVQLLSATDDITLGSGATRGLAVHPVATGVIFIALLLSLSSRFTLALLSSLLSFAAALLTVIAFAIDISLYTIVHSKVHRLGDVQSRIWLTHGAIGFWITLASLILLLIAGCTGCFGRHRSRMTGATDYMDRRSQSSSLGSAVFGCNAVL
ncbi:hypothetical protein BC826DRAFT_323054 [Russula brevipes]|nr:hypothetical protein BC826DRAFT_323054 [Russula brevipes]